MIIWLDIVPPTATHQQKRIVVIRGKSRLADRGGLRAAKRELDVALIPNRPSRPMSGAICLDLAFTWPYLRRHTKADRRLIRIPKTTRPDCSNLAKTLEDRLVALGIITDDALVCDLHVSKWHGSLPGITISISAWAPPGAAPKDALE